MRTKLSRKYTKIKTYWIKYKFYDLRFIRLLKNLLSRNISEKKVYILRTA